MTKRILVVEDQEDLRGVLRDLLTGSGYEMLEAADGQAGVDKATAGEARSDPDGHPDAGAERLRRDAPDQGRSRAHCDPDHRNQFIRHEGR